MGMEKMEEVSKFIRGKQRYIPPPPRRGWGDLVGGHAGVVQRKLCQRGKICRVHLVQLRKVCGDAHACTELTDKLDHCRCGSVRGKVPCRPMAAAMVMNRSRHTGLRLLKAST